MTVLVRRRQKEAWTHSDEPYGRHTRSCNIETSARPSSSTGHGRVDELALQLCELSLELSVAKVSDTVAK